MTEQSKRKRGWGNQLQHFARGFTPEAKKELDEIDAWNTRAFDDITKQIIKTAVEAIEDIMPSSHGIERRCKNSVCHLCDILTLEPTLEALKGLIDDNQN